MGIGPFLPEASDYPPKRQFSEQIRTPMRLDSNIGMTYVITLCHP